MAKADFCRPAKCLPGVAATPSPKNCAGAFRRTQLKHWPTHLWQHAVVRLGLQDDLDVTTPEPATDPDNRATDPCHYPRPRRRKQAISGQDCGALVMVHGASSPCPADRVHWPESLCGKATAHHLFHRSLGGNGTLTQCDGTAHARVIPKLRGHDVIVDGVAE
jgi:hypothetical protein